VDVWCWIDFDGNAMNSAVEMTRFRFLGGLLTENEFRKIIQASIISTMLLPNASALFQLCHSLEGEKATDEMLSVNVFECQMGTGHC
jgi:hypothetical protein